MLYTASLCSILFIIALIYLLLQQNLIFSKNRCFFYLFIGFALFFNLASLYYYFSQIFSLPSMTLFFNNFKLFLIILLFLLITFFWAYPHWERQVQKKLGLKLSIPLLVFLLAEIVFSFFDKSQPYFFDKKSTVSLIILASFFYTLIVIFLLQFRQLKKGVNLSLKKKLHRLSLLFNFSFILWLILAIPLARLLKTVNLQFFASQIFIMLNCFIIFFLSCEKKINLQIRLNFKNVFWPLFWLFLLPLLSFTIFGLFLKYKIDLMQLIFIPLFFAFPLSLWLFYKNSVLKEKNTQQQKEIYHNLQLLFEKSLRTNLQPNSWQKIFNEMNKLFADFANTQSCYFYLRQPQKQKFLLSFASDKFSPFKNLSEKNSFFTFINKEKRPLTYRDLFYLTESDYPQINEFRDFFNNEKICAVIPLFFEKNLEGFIFWKTEDLSKVSFSQLNYILNLSKPLLQNWFSASLKTILDLIRKEKNLKNIQQKIFKRFLNRPKIQKINNWDCALIYLNNSNNGGEFISQEIYSKRMASFLLADCYYHGEKSLQRMELLKSNHQATAQSKNINPQKFMLNLNKKITKENNFCTPTSFFMLDTYTGNFSLTNAGFAPLFVLHEGIDDILEYKPNTTPLGISTSYLPVFDGHLGKNDLAFFVNLGFYALTNNKKIPYSLDKIKKIIKDNKNGSIEEIRQKILLDLKNINFDNSLETDLCLLIIRSN